MVFQHGLQLVVNFLLVFYLKLAGNSKVLQKGYNYIDICWEMMRFCKTLDFTRFWEKRGKFPERKERTGNNSPFPRAVHSNA
jgi:hypothetical protein